MSAIAAERGNPLVDDRSRDTIEYLIRRYRLRDHVPVRLDTLIQHFTIRE
jgi:hypothetical protein